MHDFNPALSRRNLIKLAASFGLTVGLHQFLPAPARASANIVGALPPIDQYPDQVDLKVFGNKIRIGDRPTNAITVNGSVPGPTIRLKEGQLAQLNVTNQLDTDTSIHWHGLILPADMDGVPGVSFNGIKPGQTFNYKFPVNQNGTYWYHSHSGLQEQQGHFGALIIDPIKPEPFSYDRDYVVMLSDWTDTDPRQILGNLKKMSTFYNYQQRTIANLSEDADWAKMRMDPTDIADVTGATYTYLMNGSAPESNWTALFNKGEKVRLRFINASAMTFFDVQIPGLKMTVVQADGQNVQPVPVDEFRVSPAETYDVIVEPDGDRPYSIFAETMDRSGYARGTLAPQAGLVAAIPALRTRPLRTMEDMGMMDHGSHGNKAQTKQVSDKPGMDHSGHDMNSMPGMDHSGHDMNSMPGMDHSGHDMNSMPGMDHSGHDMNSMPGMDHSGKDMNSMPGMDHSGHDMNSMPGMDHSGHDMNSMPGMDHSGHDMNSMPGMDHSGHDMNSMPGMDHSGKDMNSMPGMDHSGHDMNSMPGMDHSGNDMGAGEPHSADNHGAGNSGVPMMVKNRLNEPGIGLKNTPDHRVLVYTDLRSLEPGYDRRSPDRELELHLTGNMERYMWSFDGKKYDESPILKFNYGERLRLTFVNDTMMEHPIHLHGMWMEVDNGAGAYKPRKHVLNVKPAEKCSVEVNVDATGNWAFHCHLLYHMEAGMMRTVAVVNQPSMGGAV